MCMTLLEPGSSLQAKNHVTAQPPPLHHKPLDCQMFQVQAKHQPHGESRLGGGASPINERLILAVATSSARTSFLSMSWASHCREENEEESIRLLSALTRAERESGWRAAPLSCSLLGHHCTHKPDLGGSQGICPWGMGSTAVDTTSTPLRQPREGERAQNISLRDHLPVSQSWRLVKATAKCEGARQRPAGTTLTVHPSPVSDLSQILSYGCHSNKQRTCWATEMTPALG